MSGRTLSRRWVPDPGRSGVLTRAPGRPLLSCQAQGWFCPWATNYLFRIRLPRIRIAGTCRLRAEPLLVPSPQVCFNMGQMVLAKKTLRKALKLLNRVFPSNLVSLCLQTHVEKKRHFRYMNQEAQEGPSPG